MPNLTNLDKQDMIHTLNEQRGYITSLQEHIAPRTFEDLVSILECNKLMMEIIDPHSYKLVKLFDKDEA